MAALERRGTGGGRTSQWSRGHRSGWRGARDRRGARGGRSRGGVGRRWAVGVEALSRRRRPHAWRGGDLAWHSGPRFGAASLGDKVHAGSDEGSTRSGSSGTRVWRSDASTAATTSRAEKWVRAREWRGGEVVGNFSDRGTRADKAGHMAGAQKSVGAVRTVGGGGWRTWRGRTRWHGQNRQRWWSGSNSGCARSEDAVVANKWAIGPF
jgi:hypothetical protein